MSSESERNRLPFEPGKTRKKSSQKDSAKPDLAKPDSGQKEQSSPKNNESPKPSVSSDRVTKQKKTDRKQSSPKSSRSERLKAIPDAVNKRMMTRMGIFSVTPTLLGILSLIGSYYVVSHDLFPLPNFTVLIASISCFGLGFLGITDGALSASWEEDRAGSFLGIQEFQINLGRMISAWKEDRNS